MKPLLMTAVLVAFALGCGDDKDTAKTSAPPAETDTPGETEPPPPPESPPDAGVDIATAEDFEAEAADNITEDNLEKELTEIEEELGDQ